MFPVLSSYWDLGLPHCPSLLIPRGSIASLETVSLCIPISGPEVSTSKVPCPMKQSDFSSSLVFVIGHIVYHTGLACTPIPYAPEKHACLAPRSLPFPWIHFFWFLNLSFKAYHTARMKQRKCPLTQRSNRCSSKHGNKQLLSETLPFCR